MTKNDRANFGSKLGVIFVSAGSAQTGIGGFYETGKSRRCCIYINLLGVFSF